MERPSLNADLVSGVNLFKNIFKVGLTVNLCLNINIIKMDIGKNEAMIDANDAPHIGVLNAIRKSGSKQTIFKTNEHT